MSADKIIKGLDEALAVARGEDQPAAVHVRQVTSPFIPGDLVRRIGVTIRIGSFSLIYACDYRVKSIDERGYLEFDGCDEASFNPRGFSLVQRAEGKS